LGSVASAWNYWWLETETNDTLGQFSKRSDSFDLLIEETDESFAEAWNLTVAQISNPSIPNPFGGKDNITFADGSEAGQSIPFLPLIQPERRVDFM
jgi:lysophospholipase